MIIKQSQVKELAQAYALQMLNNNLFNYNFLLIVV